MNFKSDNIVSVHPKIMDAIIKVNISTEPSYGNDQYSLKLKKKFSEIFEKEVSVFLTSTGTASNSIALSSLVKPFESIYAHHHSHINNDECGAPELFTHGAKIIPLHGDEGKINVKNIKEHIESANVLRPHKNKPGCISLSQATESGTIYNLKELQEIHDLAKFHNLPIHMDGARFANSLVTLNCSPAEATWKSGIDILSFGATKNGAMNAEAIIIFNQDYAKEFDYIHKRSGQLMSKTRFFSSQFLAYLEDDLWLDNAKHANLMALKLKALFDKYNFKIEHPVQANEVFVNLPKELASYLLEHGAGFYEWGIPGCNLYRFVTSCFTKEKEISNLNQKIQSFNMKLAK